MWKLVMYIIVVLLWEKKFISESASTSSTRDAPSASFVTLLHDMWHWRTQDSPEFASQVGINDNTAGRLDSFTNERFQKRKEHCKELLKRANNTLEDDLTFDNRINLDIFKEQIANFIEDQKYLRYFFPVSSLEGPQLHLHHLVSNLMILESYNDFQKLLARYGEFPKQVDEILEIMRENIEQGIMPHKLSMESILDQFSNLNVTLVDSAFFSPFLRIPLNLPPEQRLSLRQQAQERISQDLYPAFVKLKDFLTETYLDRTRQEPGIHSITGGNEYYSTALQFYTSTKLTPQEIHNLGGSEVERLHRELMKVARDSAFEKNMTLEELLTKMRDSEDFYFSSREDVLEAFHSAVHEKMKKYLSTSFKRLPLNNLTIDGEGSQKMHRGRTAWYEGPSLDGSRAGVFSIKTDFFKYISKHEVSSMSLHYSYPGRHLHAVFLQTSSSVPPFRKIVDASRWSLIPAEFSHNPAFTEGWALYSEYLGRELGVYDSHLESLFGTARELSAAAMLSADTGIHSLGWSIEEANKFLLKNTALPKPIINASIQRIVSWPGEACSAKVGEIKIKELRQRAENALGTLFDLDEFHNVLLKCTSSLNVVHKCVTQFIEEKIDIGESISSSSEDTESTVDDKLEDETNVNNIGAVQVNKACSSFSFQYTLVTLTLSQCVLSFMLHNVNSFRTFL